MVSKTQNLNFKISTGLKRVLGRELITDDEVAIFELVKNSFDAKAKHVYLYFDKNSIIVADDGHGMSYEDLRDKWLFVAYSSKRDKNREKQDDYRDQVADRKHYAGSKGIGRFSSDRLGRTLLLQTRPEEKKTGPVHCLNVDWQKFEQDDSKDFGNIGVAYLSKDDFESNARIPSLKKGTVIHIQNLHKEWSREELLHLKRGLAKLINPFGSETDNFKIEIIAPSENKKDQELLAKHGKEIKSELINGSVSNFIFATLKEKTTYIDVVLNDGGDEIETSLHDRGELIYRIKEKNNYELLKASGFRCRIFYLNRSAKQTFSRQMGVASVEFGSIFLFRNSFRVFPIGEPDDDWFGIARRQQQGYRRYLGSRDVIGRLDIAGPQEMFSEASSRNEGLITTPAVEQLRDCFWKHCLIRLEKYVVPVTWVDKADKDLDTLARIEVDEGRARVSAAVAALIGDEEIELVDYSKRLIDVINERSEKFEDSIDSLKLIAESTKDKALLSRIEKAEKHFVELKESEAEARRIADEEREANLAAQARATVAEAETEAVKEELAEEQKRNSFLTSISTLDADTIVNMHHQITIYAADINQQIENFLLKVADGVKLSKQDIINNIEPISLLNKRVLSVARMATRANFRLDSENIERDVSEYIRTYITQFSNEAFSNRINIEIKTDEEEFVRKFKPIDISIVVDNLISNARRAKAKNIIFDIKVDKKGFLQIQVSDNGQGIPPKALKGGKLFDKGVTTTEGSGLGLYHVRQVLGEMGGSIEVDENAKQGAAFIIRIPS